MYKNANEFNRSVSVGAKVLVIHGVLASGRFDRIAGEAFDQRKGPVVELESGQTVSVNKVVVCPE